MPLSQLIEIVPLTAPVHAEITVPGSKSITNRALILAALADGEVTLQGALWSEDTQVMVECLGKLGFEVRVEPDPNEFCNRTITVRGLGGKIPNGGTAEQPLELFVGNAGTAARFLAAMVCLGSGVYRVHGVPRMHERPQAALFAALHELGYCVDSPNDKLPVVIGEKSEARSQKSERTCIVSVEESSQFASALILSAEIGGWRVEVTGANEDEMPYVEMTRQLIQGFPKHGGVFTVEPDASSGSYFWAAGELKPAGYKEDELSVKVARWPWQGDQIDARFPHFHLTCFCSFSPDVTLARMVAAQVQRRRQGSPQEAFSAALGVNDRSSVSRQRDLSDSIMTMIALAPVRSNASFFKGPILFTDLGRLRLQECERVVALRTELTKCGAKVIETGDTLEVFPSQLHGAEIETYNDHRMAMCFAILGLKVPGIKIKNPACVKKTFPNFFQKLATSPPHGLGATILDGHTGRRLAHEELFAE